MTRSVPTGDEVQALLRDMQQQRARLAALVSGGGDVDLRDLAAAVDEIGENLLVADEELRVQNEHLMQSAHRLDLLAAAHEELFAGADVAYLQTDLNGVVVRLNRAARKLLALPGPSERSSVFVNYFRPEDRNALRDLVTRALRRHEQAPSGPATVTAAVIFPDGRSTPVSVRVRRSGDGGPGRILLHWELRASAPDAAPPARQQASALQVVADAAAELAQQNTPAATLQHVASRAKDAVSGCDEVGVSLVRSPGTIETPAATGEIALACDRLQYELGEGPCIGAIDDARPIRVPAMASEDRWPRFAPQAAQLGVGSMLVLPLAVPRGVLGALNLYATSPDAFDEDGELIAQAFATHAAIALAHAEMEANLRTGLASREEIGRAVGIMMERHRVTATRAFDMLVYVSQHTHRKLREIAAWVESTGEDPSSLLPAPGQRQVS